MITDVPGIRVGHVTDPVGLTGCTVVLTDRPAVGGVELRGWGGAGPRPGFPHPPRPSPPPPPAPPGPAPPAPWAIRPRRRRGPVPWRRAMSGPARAPPWASSS